MLKFGRASSQFKEIDDLEFSLNTSRSHKIDSPLNDRQFPGPLCNLLLIAPIAVIELALFRLLVPPGFLNGDVAWFVMVADEVVFGGQRLYVDFVEPNAPLASLIMTPAALFHHWMGLSIAEATTAWVLALTVICFSLAFPLTRRFPFKPGQLLLAQALLIWTMLILPGGSFGQRESIFAMMATPYVLAAALRGTPMQMGTALAIPVGAVAAIGVGVKPPMVLGLMTVELVSLIRTRRLFHAEAIVLAVSLFLYAVATLLVFPFYFELMQGWATSLYFAYSEMPGSTTYPTMFIAFTAVAVAALCSARRPLDGTSVRRLRWLLAPAALAAFLAFLYFSYSAMAGFSYLTKFIVLAAAIVAGVCTAMGPAAGFLARGLPLTLAAATIGSFLGFLLQWKGWEYQALPAHYFATLALASSLAVMIEPVPLRLMQVAIVALPLSLAGLILPLRYPAFTQRPNEEISQNARQTEGAFLVLSTNVHSAFPEAAEIGRRWALRYPCLILLPGLVQSEERNGGVIEERYRKAETDFVNAVTEDFRRHQPSLVLVPKGRDAALPDGITGLDWLLRQKSFAEEWNHYREQDSSRTYRIFRRIS